MKKKIFFFVYCAFMVVGIILFLIFTPKLMQNKTSTQPSQYASKIQLNCNDNIILSVGSSVTLLNNYITVLPTNTISNVRHEISSKNANISGISFYNNIIKANAVGVYTIKFLVKKSETVDIYDSMKISVVDEENDTNVQILNNNFTSNTTVNVSNIFSFDEMFTSYSINDNNYLNYNKNLVEFTSIGQSTINLNLKTNYLLYKYNFNITINSQATSNIQIENEINGILEVNTNIGDTFEIMFRIIYNSSESENQQVLVTTENENSIEILSTNSPVITCKCLSKNSTTLTITPINTNIPPKQLTIIFK